jgi:hypothetical protein
MCIERYEDGPYNKFSYGIRIGNVEEQSWSYKVGIESKDILMQINGQDAKDLTTAEAEDEMFGKRPCQLIFQSHRRLDVKEDYEAALEAQMLGDEEDPHLEKYFEKAVEDYVPNITNYLPDSQDVYHKSFYLSPGVLKMFPSTFLLFCVAIFIVPAFLVVYANSDTNSRHFFPQLAPWLLVLPALYVMAYIAHTAKGSPSKFWVVLSLVGSGVVLLVVADLLLIDVYEKGPAFSYSSDCGAWAKSGNSRRHSTSQQHGIRTV